MKNNFLKKNDKKTMVNVEELKRLYKTIIDMDEKLKSIKYENEQLNQLLFKMIKKNLKYYSLF